ncbi:MAG TPA: hypothetical protein VGF45_01560 [Polyangia bacterium]
MTAAALHALRVAVAAILIASVSGAPTFVSSTIGDEECSDDCDGRLGKSCSPFCADGACAKVFPTELTAPVEITESPGVAWQVAFSFHTPPLLLTVGGIFHPPRA